MTVRFGSIFAAALLLVLAGCDNPEPSDSPATAAPAEQAATAGEDPAVDESAEAAVSDETAGDAASEVESVADAAVAETEGMEEESEGVGSIQLARPGANDANAEPVDWKYEEGKHFRRMSASQGTSSPPDKIEVAEVFWYGCPHCYDFEPVLNQWKEQAPADVAFVRIPVIWNPTNQIHAKVMYTAEALGVFEQAHKAVFRAIHQENKTLTTEADIVEFFGKLGVEEDAFREAFNSFGVSSAVKRAENLTRRYGVRSVPLLVVNGKYATDAPDVRTFADMVNVTEELVERERRGL